MAVQSVEFDLDHMIGKIDRLQYLEVPYAASVAVNRVAVLAKDAIRAEMPRAFDRPVPFTLNSLYMKASSKTNLEAEVGLRDFAPKGNPASKYLAPQIYGGPAYATRFQKSLRFNGILAPNRYAIPTQSDNLRVNQYGNVSPGMYTEILYKLKAFRDMSAFSYGKHSAIHLNYLPSFRSTGLAVKLQKATGTKNLAALSRWHWPAGIFEGLAGGRFIGHKNTRDLQGVGL